MCEELMNPDNGLVTVKSYLALGTAVFECDPGYSLNGSRTLYCTMDELWSSEVSSCLGKLLKPSSLLNVQEVVF